MTSPTTLHTILITGINGFIATEVALTFLEAGYAVRGTVRSIEKAELWKASYAQYIDRLQVCVLFFDMWRSLMQERDLSLSKWQISPSLELWMTL